MLSASSTTCLPSQTAACSSTSSTTNQFTVALGVSSGVWAVPCCALLCPALSCQVVMSAHKEGALDEKRYHFRFGSTCVTGFSQVIHTSSFDSFDAFFAHLQEEWDKLWGQVFSADAAGAAQDGGHREGRGRMLRQYGLSRGLGRWCVCCCPVVGRSPVVLACCCV